MEPEIDWRLESLRKSLLGKPITINCLPEIIDTLFYKDAQIPTSNPSLSIESALRSYWAFMQSAAELLSRDEWVLLSGSDFFIASGAPRYRSAKDAYDDFMEMHDGENWSIEIGEIKRVIQKIKSCL